MRSITIRAEDALVDALDARSESEGVSRNAVAVAALQSYLQSKEPESNCNVGADAITVDCKTSESDCNASAAADQLLEALRNNVDQLTAQNAELTAALRESMAATSDAMATARSALDTAKAAQALQAASKPGLVERVRGFFSRP